MKRHEAEKLTNGFRELVQQLVDESSPQRPSSAAPSGAGNPPATARPPALPPTNGSGAEPLDFEALYQRIRKRLLDELPIDPILLTLIAQRPELLMQVERRVVTLETSTLRGRVGKLMAEGWFSQAKATSAVRKELARTGSDPGGGGTLSDILAAFTRDGFLERDEAGAYVLAPGVKATKQEMAVTA